MYLSNYMAVTQHGEDYIKKCESEEVHVRLAKDVQEATLAVIREEVKASIKENVNGKIDRMSEKVDDVYEKLTINIGVQQTALMKATLEQNTLREEDAKERKEQWGRILPIIEKYEKEKIFNEEATKKGKVALFWASVVAGIGGVIIMAKQLGL